MPLLFLENGAKLIIKCLNRIYKKINSKRNIMHESHLKCNHLAIMLTIYSEELVKARIRELSYGIVKTKLVKIFYHASKVSRSDFSHLSIKPKPTITHKVCHSQNKHPDIVQIIMIMMKTITMTCWLTSITQQSNLMILTTADTEKVNQTETLKQILPIILDTPTHLLLYLTSLIIV